MDNILPPVEPKSNAVNTPRHFSRRSRASLEEYIEISSSSSLSSGQSDDEDVGQVEPPECRNYRLQQQPASQPVLPSQPSSPSPPGLATNRVAQPVARDSFTKELSPASHLLQQNLVTSGDEVNFNEHLNDFDNFDDLDIRDANLAKAMEDEFRAGMIARNLGDNGSCTSDQQAVDHPLSTTDAKEECLSMVKAVFPDICVEHISGLYDTISRQSDRIITHILENMDRGNSYPKAIDTKKTLKRKRELGEDDEAALKYSAAHRPTPPSYPLQRYIRTVLSVEFPDTPMAFIDTCLRQNGQRMFSTYRILEEAERTYSLENPPYNKIRTKRKMPEEYREANIQAFTAAVANDQGLVDLLEEFQASRKVRRKADARREEERQVELAEEANLLKAQAEGTILDCQCCFGDYPMNRMVHCDNEEVMHWFCKDCTKRNAETVIGQSKYHLVCMSMDGCMSSFSIAQRSHFLNDRMIIALERNEQEANLRMAGIENLASCPFCSYAAEYPPVEIDKEFRCEAPDCRRISCRLCKLESHIPKSCEENSKEVGLSVRREIEEAMSEALIRKCNKCGTPFVKEEGCNKMTCTRSGCGNVQCYVCSRSCTYSHFNDEHRGGKAGNCPLFEKTSQRHEDEVKKAEKVALEKIRAKHPELREEDLTVKVSEAVLQDEQRRHGNEVVPRPAGPPGYHAHQMFRIARPAAGARPVLNMANNPVQNAPGKVRHQQPWPLAGGIFGIQHPRPPPLMPFNDLAVGNRNIMALAGSLEEKALAIQNPHAEMLDAPDMHFHHAPRAVPPLAPILRHVALDARPWPEPPVYQHPPPPQPAPAIADPKHRIFAVPQRAPQRFMSPIERDQDLEGDVK